MAASLKFFCLVGFLLIVNIATFARVDGAGDCGDSSPDDEAMKLAPCATAAQDEKAPVSASCCTNVQRIGQNPNCLCAALLSDNAKLSGVKPQVAMSIPKRCNITDLPADYKCGRMCLFIALGYLFYLVISSYLIFTNIMIVGFAAYTLP